MAWTRPRSGPKGVRHTGYYRDPAGRTRSAGTLADERRALAAAIRAEGKVAEGTWFDRPPGGSASPTMSRPCGGPACTSRSPR